MKSTEFFTISEFRLVITSAAAHALASRPGKAACRLADHNLSYKSLKEKEPC